MKCITEPLTRLGKLRTAQAIHGEVSLSSQASWDESGDIQKYFLNRREKAATFDKKSVYCDKIST